MTTLRKCVIGIKTICLITSSVILHYTTALGALLSPWVTVIILYTHFTETHHNPIESTHNVIKLL